MIKNQRQYRITKAQADRFAQALSRLSAPGQDQQVDPLLRQLQQDALQSQLDDLREELAEYDAVRAGQYALPGFALYMELPRLLIQRRIASGMSQKDLADQLGLKEQQVQQYEATDYASASFGRLQEMMRALEVRPAIDSAAVATQASLQTLLDRLKEIGFDRKFATTRLIPRRLLAQLEAVGEAGEESKVLVLRAAEAAGRLLDLSAAALFGTGIPKLDSQAALAGVRFKVAAGGNEEKIYPYTVYAHHLARLVLDATQHLPIRPIPTDWREVRSAILSSYGTITFEHVLRYMWDQGVPVLPLRDAGAFHGACWRVNGRNVIVLKQQTQSPARLAHVALHEFRHAGEAPEASSFAVVEAGLEDHQFQRRDDEQVANTFAGNVLLNGQAEELAHRCASEANGYIPFLKRIVPRVANQEGVPVDSLANYLAYRLTLEGTNWWGTAATLQESGVDAWELARSVFAERVQVDQLEQGDQMALMQALAEGEG